MYIEDLIVIVRWLALIVAIIDLSIVAYILIRRAARNRYYAQKDATHREFAGLVRQYASGTLTMSQAVTTLSRVRSPAQMAAIQELLLQASARENRERISDLLFQLGYIRMWAVQAFGARRAKQLVEHFTSDNAAPLRKWKRSFPRIRRLRVFAVKRALPTHNFGYLAPKYAEVLLVEALQDPSPYVTGPAVAALGRTLSPAGIPILLEQLQKASEGRSEIPVRAAKTSLVRHSIHHLKEFIPFLDSGDDRFRLLIVDTIREMLNVNPSLVEAKDFPAGLYRWFIEQAARDTSADVRARSAEVIRHFHDENSVATLRTLLRDTNEYVRLHAARACADPFYEGLVQNLVECITDERWRVREAAAKSLAAIGSAGVNSMADFFLSTDDRYASEQIADELQRSGMILRLVSMLGSQDGEANRASAVCAKIAGMGMTSLFSDLLRRKFSEPVQAELMSLLKAYPDPQTAAALQRLAFEAEDPNIGV